LGVVRYASIYGLLANLTSANLPADVESAVKDPKVRDVLEAAIGEKDRYLFLIEKTEIDVLRKTSTPTVTAYHGQNLHKRLVDYCFESDGSWKRDAGFRLVFGPGDSFIAWDLHSMCWHNVPRALESILQERFACRTWCDGAPQTVALGQDGSFYISTKMGEARWNIQGSSLRCFRDIDMSTGLERDHDIEVKPDLKLWATQMLTGSRLCS
jgi:hypothetical protein